MSITNTEGERAWRHSDGRAFHQSAARKETECKPYRHDLSREEWNLPAELSCSVHPGLSLLYDFILDNALVSEKVVKF